jgi:hypothetical protein
MSNVDLVLNAILADIPPNIESDLGDEIWSAHHKLKTLLLEELAGQPDAKSMIERYREEPDIYGSVLADALLNSGAASDPAVLEAAGEVLALVDPLDADTDSDDVMNVPGTYGTGDVSTDHV